MAELTEDHYKVDDVEDPESTPKDVQYKEEVDEKEEESTPEVLLATAEKSHVPISPLASSSTIQSEYNSNQFLMENFNFSFSSLPERAKSPETYYCRICHQRSTSEPNLSPCHCRGTMGLIHKSCLERWLAASDSNKCEICHFNFTVKRQPKFGILKAIKIWLQTEECKADRLQLTMDIVRFVGSLPLIIFLNHLTAVLYEIFHFEETETCDFYSYLTNVEDLLNIASLKDVIIFTGRMLTYFSVGFMSAMDVVAGGWFFSRVQEHYSVWYKWYRTQCIICVILPESSEEEIHNK